MKKLFFLSGLLFTVLTAKAENQKRYSTEDYIDLWKITAIEQMNQYQIPASITLAQGILESANGNSRLATEGNNHFGIKCHKNWDGGRIYEDDDLKNECFRSYANASQSYEDHSLFLTGRSRYENLFTLSITDYKGWAKGLKAAGYATNPKYAHLLIDIIEKYDLAKYDIMPYLPADSKKEDLSIEVDEPAIEFDKPSQLHEEKLDELEIEASRHEIKVNKYRTRYVKVQKGDTYYRIAKEFELGLWQLYKYNDLGKRDVLKEGEIIYLDPKRNRSKRGNNVYICHKEMSLRDVAQVEGIKLKKLLKYNFGNKADEVLPAGTKVILR
ncbi:glucosaminidase domain-containing protein [Paracrocinitomix mangrovi]|uniref:glucosaminidase domain-containing protein n=1 Tax=Paracrocinitomix mangrovi TaxID=2862509 RepID=UPI001C8D7333|nr:glucosaminidase domain-containing protein [Paracrocinitomix mangrovi]UKN01644.1 glucosaminidase domain-containing protein [Paracrocinitomix mangrovi]